MGDKLKRYVSVSNNGVSLVNDEALRDTLKDLHNYSAMAIMLMDEEKDSALSVVKAALTDEPNKPLYNKHEVYTYTDLSDEEPEISEA